MKAIPMRLGKWLFSMSIVAALALAGPAWAAESKGPIKIVENDWTGNLVDIRLGKIILEEEMGYEVDLVFIDYLAQWVALAQGDLHVAMEVWPSYVRPQMEEHIAEYGGSGEVTSLGHLGVSGRPGYYIFDYMLHGDAERGIEACCPDLTDWSKLNEYKDAFKAPESGDQGRWVGAPVAAWAAHDEERLANLDLDFQHVGLGSDVALISEIESYHARGEPLVYFMWEPHWVPAKYALTRLPFPDYSDECFGYAEDAEATFACDFPSDDTIIIASTQWVEDNPEAAQFFRNFNLANEHQNGLILEIEVNEMDLEEAVRKWMAENEDVWRAWIP